MDIISQLHNDLLVRILSFIPTNYTIVTSLLSKRWRYLWTIVPKLEYDYRHQPGRFSQFVYRSLLLNKAPVLESLSLTIHNECQAVDIRIWVDIAVARGVQELEIKILYSQEGPISYLPNSLYRCETLESLTLANYNGVLTDVPSSICLPSLRKLHLWLMDYRDNAPLLRLLAGCPNLRELYLGRRDGNNHMIMINRPA